MPNVVKNLAAAVIAWGVLLAPAVAGTVNEDHGLAIKGYDPVAYFTDARPVAGSAQYEYAYDGATYRFATAAHRDAFAANPAKYAPQFGGFCAFGTAAGHKADIDPAAFTIVDGKLYLNYSLDVMAKWRQDVPANLTKAASAWPEVSQQTEVIR